MIVSRNFIKQLKKKKKELELFKYIVYKFNNNYINIIVKCDFDRF